MAKQQKLVPPEDQATMMIPKDETPEHTSKSEKKSHERKMKVHMTLHTGRAVGPGLASLTDEELEHLEKSFGDGLAHILE